jgi:hypothetical protein
VTQPPLPLPKREGKVRKGRRTQRPSDGEPPPPDAASTPRVEVRRSGRRTRTVTAYRERDTIVVLIPQRMSKADEQTFVKDMVERVLAREARASTPRGDDALATRARELAATYLASALEQAPEPRAVSWVTNQQQRWGSCTPSTGVIRLSHRLQPLPAWVVDYVLLHEWLIWWSPLTLNVSGVSLAGIRRPRRLRAIWRASWQARACRLSRSMSTEQAARRRTAVVLARYDASAAAPEGIDPANFAAACLLDSYEVVADLIGVTSGIAGAAAVAEMLWPGALHLPAEMTVPMIAHQLSEVADELVVLPADLPDLPGLVLAKLFKVLHRTDLAIAPEQAGRGCAAIGVSLPLADWIPDDALDLDHNPFERLTTAAPRRSSYALGPTWHRLRTPADLRRLDPGLEGWEETRALLADRALAAD